MTGPGAAPAVPVSSVPAVDVGHPGPAPGDPGGVDPDTAASVMLERSARGPRGRPRAFRARCLPALLPLITVGTVLVALTGPLWAGSPDRTVGPPFRPAGSGSSLGTDYLGRDVLDRVLAGRAALLGVALLATLAASVVGVIAGLLSALPGRAARWLLLLLTVVLIVPPVLVMLVGVFGGGPGIGTVVLVVVLTGAPVSARYVRSVAAPVLASGYVEVARAAGDNWPTVLVREVAPNLVGPVLADLGSRFIAAFYLIAAAGFLQLAPLAGGGDWATMIRQNLAGLGLNPWAVLAPALAITAITVPVNLLADRLLQRWGR